MLVLLNERFVPEEEAVISVFDRGFLYGDGLFETIKVFNGNPFRWSEHFERFRRGADFLGIELPFASGPLLELARELVRKNEARDALMRVMVSRGVGLRGYSPRGAKRPTWVISTHVGSGGGEEMRQWRLQSSSVRLPANEPLAQFKTCNKLAQIISRTQADAAKADEALLLNTDGFVVEGSSSNLFWIKDDIIHTPPLASGILAGVTRSVVKEISADLGVSTRECNVVPEQILEADGVFLSLTSVGIAEAVALDDQPLKRSALSGRLHAAYWALLRKETL